MPTATISDLSIYEAQKAAIEPFLRTFRLSNTALDIVFYDVGVLYKDLQDRGQQIATGMTTPIGSAGALAVGASPQMARAITHLDLSALTNPEGAILVVDAANPPYVYPPYRDVAQFLNEAGTKRDDLRTVTLTGVGSSALGSVAFAWGISKALGEPVVAIVPGYGLADVAYQALGGWFGFGLHDWIRSQTQEWLAAAAPHLAGVGRHLLASLPDGKQNPDTAAPVFRQGSVGSDTLHAILQRNIGITRVVGHSKGALAIANAIRSLASPITDPLSVVTFGCTVNQDGTKATYDQFLGRIDALGRLNSWCHEPKTWLIAHHSTNTMIPLAMAVDSLISTSPARSAAPVVALPSWFMSWPPLLPLFRPVRP